MLFYSSRPYSVPLYYIYLYLYIYLFISVIGKALFNSVSLSLLVLSGLCDMHTVVDPDFWQWGHMRWRIQTFGWGG